MGIKPNVISNIYFYFIIIYSQFDFYHLMWARALQPTIKQVNVIWLSNGKFNIYWIFFFLLISRTVISWFDMFLLLVSLLPLLLFIKYFLLSHQLLWFLWIEIVRERLMLWYNIVFSLCFMDNIVWNYRFWIYAESDFSIFILSLVVI